MAYQRGNTATGGPGGGGWAPVSLDGNSTMRDPAPTAPTSSPMLGSAGMKYRIACERVSVGDWMGEAELAVLDGSCLQILFPNDPPLTLSLHNVTAAQLKVLGADTSTLQPLPGQGGGSAATKKNDDRLAGVSEFARAQAAPSRPHQAEQPSPRSAGPPVLPLVMELLLELEQPLTPEGSPHFGRLLRAEALLDEASKLGQLVQATHAARSSATHLLPLTLGVPSWALKVPHHLYSDGFRRLLERLWIVWTVGTVFWAIWQLYHNVELIHAAFEPMVLFLYARYTSVLDDLDAFLTWMTLVFYAWFRPLTIVAASLRPLLQPLYTALSLLYQPVIQAAQPLLVALGRLSQALGRIPIPRGLVELGSKLQQLLGAPARALATAISKIPLGKLRQPLMAMAGWLGDVVGKLLELLRLAASNPKHAMAFVRNNLKTVVQGIAKLVPVLGTQLRRFCPGAFAGAGGGRAEGVLGMSSGGAPASGGIAGSVGSGATTDYSSFYSNDAAAMHSAKSMGASVGGATDYSSYYSQDTAAMDAATSRSGAGGGGGSRDWPGSSSATAEEDDPSVGGISDWISSLNGVKGKGD